MTTKTKLELAKEKITTMREQQQNYLQDNEDEFEKVVKDLTVKQIEDMSDDEILSFNNYAEGCYYINEPEFETKEELADYVRSIIKFLVQTYEFTVDLENRIKEYNELNEETDRMLKEAFGIKEDGSSINVIENAIEKGLAKAKESGDEESYNKILQSKNTFNETFTLKRLKELYEGLDADNLKEDAKSDRSISIYKKYLKVQQKLGLRYDLTQVSDLEVRFLPEEYHELNNLFIFTIIKYISKILDSNYTSDSLFFISQLATNLFLLHQDKLPYEYKEVLLMNIREFLDMIK